MAHPTLFITFLIMMILHFVAKCWFSGLIVLQWAYLSGPSTSVWNHGTMNTVALWSDRSMMTIGFLIDLYFMYKLPMNEGAIVFIFTATAFASYLCAKFMSGFERPLTKEGKALTMREIKIIPSLFSRAFTRICFDFTFFNALLLPNEWINCWRW
jgi:hypothetical protein